MRTLSSMRNAVVAILVFCMIHDAAESAGLNCFGCAGSSCTWCTDPLLPEFEIFCERFAKSYEAMDFPRRFRTFKNNLYKIHELNSKCQCNTYGLNQFSDLEKNEVVGQKAPTSANGDDFEGIEIPCSDLPPVLTSHPLPAFWDWRTQGVQTPVKNQYWTGTCYAQGAVGAIEHQYAMKHGEGIGFSTQQVLDCDPYDCGLGGGYISSSFSYLRGNSLATEESYPQCIKAHYRDSCLPCMLAGPKCSIDAPETQKEFEEHCNATLCQATGKPGVKVTGCFQYQSDGTLSTHEEEDVMARLVVAYGPITVQVNCALMQMYGGDGVIYGSESDCEPSDLDHAVLLMGFGTTADGTPYWIVKNSWGEEWGEKGYLKLKRGVGQCGINRSYYGAYIEDEPIEHGPSYSITSDRDSARAEDKLRCSWAASPASSDGDFIALFSVYADPLQNSFEPSTLRYLPAGYSSGSVLITVPPHLAMGYYLCRLLNLRPDGTRQPLSHSQSILVTTPDYTVVASSILVERGSNITCYWKAASGALPSQDFIGIFYAKDSGAMPGSWVAASEFLESGMREGYVMLRIPQSLAYYVPYSCYYVTAGRVQNTRRAFSESFSVRFSESRNQGAPSLNLSIFGDR